MRWQGREESENVEDDRGAGGMSRPMMAGGGGAGVVIIALIMWACGVDPGKFLAQVQQQQGQQQQIPQGGPQQGGPVQEDPKEAERVKFVKTVLHDTEVVWGEQLPKQTGVKYVNPTLVLFRNQVQSGCGPADAGMGPFYCPADKKVYLDLEFYEELRTRFGAPGEFAQAYVIAHEIGHHVQDLLGTSDKVDQQRRRADKRQGNKLSVMLELQADFYAGVFSYHANKKYNMLEDGDIESAMNCAAKIGDDALQRQATGRVVPDSFTHGTSAQRVKWFKLGLQTGDMSKGDTFKDPELTAGL